MASATAILSTVAIPPRGTTLSDHRVGGRSVPVKIHLTRSSVGGSQRQPIAPHVLQEQGVHVVDGILIILALDGYHVRLEYPFRCDLRLPFGQPIDDLVDILVDRCQVATLQEHLDREFVHGGCLGRKSQAGKRIAYDLRKASTCNHHRGDAHFLDSCGSTADCR